LSDLNQAKEKKDMRTQNKFSLFLVLMTILMLVTACGPTGTPDTAATFNPMVTAAAQTMEALLTQAANPLPTQPSGGVTPQATFTQVLAPTQTGFVLPTVSPFPTSTSTPITKCDWISFIADVTVADGTTYAPSTAFVKTWRLKNIGTCTWTPSYSLVFVSGDQMGAPAAIAMPNVAPGQTVDLSVSMVAPATVKAYTGNWMLKNASGVVFGFGPSATSAFWVKINVTIPAVSAIVYDFVANYTDATWVCAAGPTACTVGSTSDPVGFVMKLNTPHLENNTTGTDPALLTHPQNVNDGYISGTYPAFTVQSGDHFKATVGCQYGSTVCFVRYKLNYQVGSDPVKTLAKWDEKYDNQTYAWDVDLSSLAGKSVVFILRVESLGSPLQDDALWSAARITRTTPVSTTGSCQIVSQSVIPVKTTYPANDDLDFVWNVKNTGTFDWIKTSVDWVYVSGTKMHKPAFGDVRDLPLDVVKGGTIQLVMDALAPATNGTYSETWALKQGSTVICTMSVTIKVAP
jgi:hypothetical protein